jgi:uncharacterized protein (TIGR00730 family)
MKISVYGSAKPEPGQPEYEQARILGSLLGNAGYTVITGGYMGSMAAVSQGAAEVGAHVIGVTCEEIEAWRLGAANRWVKEEWRTATILQRIEMMLRNSDAAIALPGGIGTLTEIMVTWNYMAVEAVNNYRLVILGETWQQLLELFSARSGLVSAVDQKRLHFTSSIEQAVHIAAGDLPSQDTN